jgi:RNA polymerase sigma-70 factor, ECF subfamily
MTPVEIEGELERLHPAAFAWALACSGRDREEAQDVLQASYLKVLEGRARFRGQSAFKTFLFGVIRRTASEERRRKAVRGLLLGKWGPVERSGSSTQAPEERMAVLAALAGLARRQREVLELVFYMGMTVDEAGEVLSISAGSARLHYDRGKKRLFQELRERASR